MADIHRVDAAEEGYAPEAREPAGYRLSDASIKEQIFRQLALGEGLEAGGIMVEVRDGEVTLSGSARSYVDMQWIEELICAIEAGNLLRKIVATALSDEHIFSLQGGRSTKSGQRAQGAAGYGLNPKGQPHSAMIAAETMALVIYAGEPDEIKSMEIVDIAPAG